MFVQASSKAFVIFLWHVGNHWVEADRNQTSHFSAPSLTRPRKDWESFCGQETVSMLACVHELWCFYTQDNVQFIFPETKRTMPFFFFLVSFSFFKCWHCIKSFFLPFFLCVSFRNCYRGALQWHHGIVSSFMFVSKASSDYLFSNLIFNISNQLQGLTATLISPIGREILHKILKFIFSPFDIRSFCSAFQFIL